MILEYLKFRIRKEH